MASLKDLNRSGFTIRQARALLGLGGGGGANDQLVLSKAHPSVGAFEYVNWTGVTPDVLTGTGIAVVGGVVTIVQPGTYAFTGLADFDPAAGGSSRGARLVDDLSPMPGLTNNGRPSGGMQHDIRSVSLTIALSADQVPDPFSFGMIQDSGGPLAVFAALCVQRLS